MDPHKDFLCVRKSETAVSQFSPLFFFHEIISKVYLWKKNLVYIFLSLPKWSAFKDNRELHSLQVSPVKKNGTV